MADRYYRLSVITKDPAIGIWVSTFHYRVPEADDVGPNDFTAAWWAAMQDTWDDGLASDSHTLQVHAVEVPNGPVAPPLPAVGDAFVTDTGERTVNRLLDGALCCRATLHTGVSGKRHRGGWYGWPLLHSTDLVSPGGINPASSYILAANAFLTHMLATSPLVSGAAHYTWVVYSKKATALGQEPGKPVTGYVLDPSSQYWLRRREAREQ